MNDDTSLDRTVQAAWRDFQANVDALRPTLYRYCRHLTRSPWDAEDLVQDTFARAFASLGGMQESPRDRRAWLFRVASNLWIDRVRRRPPAPPADEPRGEGSSREVREAAGTLLVQLSPQERAAVVLKDAFDVSLEEIADILSTSVGAVKAALHRGRGKLADPDLDSPRTPTPAALDAFCRAFNAGDLDRVAALLLESATVEVVGTSLVHGRQKARTTVLPGMLLGSARMAAPEDGGQGNGIDPRFAQGVLPGPARLEVRHAHGEPLLLSWYQHRDGQEAVRAVSRVEIDAASGGIARLWNYFFTPEVIAEVCGELGLPHRTNGTFSGCVRPIS
jgi:RNA polymerase sigma-70 factor (ECF subfamily)